jgi:steroid delta-isomerase-like uncharacterized protein
MLNAKQVLERAVDAWNRKDLDGVVALARPEAKITSAGGIELHGLEGIRQYYVLWRTACPDNIVQYRNVVAEDDRLIGEATFTGTHTGILHHPAGEIPPTGKRLSIDYVGAFRMVDGKIASLRIYFDVMELMQQLGLVPQPASATVLSGGRVCGRQS